MDALENAERKKAELDDWMERERNTFRVRVVQHGRWSWYGHRTHGAMSVSLPLHATSEKRLRRKIDRWVNKERRQMARTVNHPSIVITSKRTP